MVHEESAAGEAADGRVEWDVTSHDWRNKPLVIFCFDIKREAELAFFLKSLPRAMGVLYL